VLEPALGACRKVVSDRFTASSLAYQGYGRGLDVSHVECLNRWATAGLAPDLVILLDVPGDEARSRLRRSGRTLDRLESEEADFHERVAAGFELVHAVDAAVQLEAGNSELALFLIGDDFERRALAFDCQPFAGKLRKTLAFEAREGFFDLPFADRNRGGALDGSTNVAPESLASFQFAPQLFPKVAHRLPKHRFSFASRQFVASGRMKFDGEIL